jgi:FAD/FMN-containing dehydrogenase
VIERLARIVAPSRIAVAAEQLDAVSWDALSESRIHPRQKPDFALPLCAVEPESTAEIQAIVLLANEEEVSIVPYGGGSGLMGGAVSLEPGIVLDLRRMNAILGIDREAASLRAQAGAVLESLGQALRGTGLILGHDPWTLPVATLGGAISTDSMGYRGGLYGSMGEQVLGLEAVLPNGEILRTRPVSKSSAGPSLKRLLIGGEGCFGIITEATIRVFPEPEARALRAFAFRSFEEGYRAIQELFRLRLRPALVDFGDEAAASGGSALLYLGFEGNREVVRAEERVALAACLEHGGKRLPDERAESFWRDRHAIAYRFLRQRRRRREASRDGIYRDWIHVALPPSRVLAFRERAIAALARHGVTLQESGLWVGPELFSMRLAAEGSEEARAALEEAIDELVGLVHEMDGSMEYTHGVGIKLARHMAAEHGYGLEVMRRIKTVLDPKNIMNPGKLGF